MTKDKPFAVFDIDGTLVRWQLYHAIVEALIDQQHLSPQAAQTIAEARNTWKKRVNQDSFSAYEHTLLDVYQQSLTSLHRRHFMEAVHQAFEQHKDQVYTYTRSLLKQLKGQQYTLLAISGSQQEIIDLLGPYYGFDYVVGSHFHTDSRGYFTGQMDIPALIGKDNLLKELVGHHHLSWANSYAVGDSAGDAPMLNLVANPIAFNPDNKLFDIASHHHWPIIIERKNVVYQLQSSHQGYILQTKSDQPPRS